MFDGLTDAAELVSDLLDSNSGLNSGSSPAPGPTATGAGGSGAGGGSGSPPRRDEPTDDPGRDPVDTLTDMHDPMLQDNVEEASEVARDLTNEGPSGRKRLRDHLSDLFSKRIRPRFPGNPADQLLSEEGAEAQRGAARSIHEQRNRLDNLATADHDVEGYYDRRQEGPYADLGGSDDQSGSSDDEADRSSGSSSETGREEIHPDAQEILDDIEVRRQMDERQQQELRDRMEW